MGKPRTPAGRAKVVAERLAELYPGAECELTHSNPYELLAATILSAQCTDVRVNMVTPELFKKYPTPLALSQANPSELEAIVKSTGFYQSKAKNLIGMATRVMGVPGESFRMNLKTSSRFRVSVERRATCCEAWYLIFLDLLLIPMLVACLAGWGSLPKKIR